MNVDRGFLKREDPVILDPGPYVGGNLCRNARKVTGAAAGGAQGDVGGGDSVNVSSIPRRATSPLSTSHATENFFWNWTTIRTKTTSHKKAQNKEIMLGV
jgi:hypothetical protein